MRNCWKVKTPNKRSTSVSREHFREHLKEKNTDKPGDKKELTKIVKPFSTLVAN